MSVFSNIWRTALLAGTRQTTDASQKTQIIHANRMAFFSLSTMIFFFFLFAFSQLYLLMMIISVSITLLFLSFTICQLGKFTIARLMYIMVPNLTIFTFANILGEDAGIQSFLFTLLISTFTFFSTNERKLLVLSVSSVPLVWIILEFTNYELLNMYMDIGINNIRILKILCYTFSFGVMIFFLYQFLGSSYSNEELLYNSINKLKLKEKELIEKNNESQKTTQELIGIQQLLSSNQEILKQEKDKAEHALKVKTDFLSSMSHEIRTPMNVIVGLTDLLIDIETDPEKTENLELIKNSSNNLLVIINDILDFSRMESGKMIIEIIEFDLYKKANEIIKTFNVRTKQNNNKLNIHIQKNVPQIISSDPVRITQVLMNLLSNANKFTKDGHIDIHISSKPKSKTRTNISFEIRDTGIGIEKNSQAKIFDSFTQASSSTTRKFGGTGLGLPICKRIIDIMDGKIWVESEVNVGSSFFFVLSVAHKIPNGDENAHTNIPINCLVNEDFEMNQMILEKVLSSIDIRPEFAINLSELEVKLKDNHFNFILLDFKKADFTTTEIANLLKQYPQLPILVFDNLPQEEKLPFDAILIDEPLNKNQLLVLKDKLSTSV